jgi:Flp pilus assembly protein TadD
VRQEPGNAEAQFLLGRVYMRQGEYGSGMDAFQEARESSARYVEKIDFLIEKYAHEEFRKGKSATESGSYGSAARHFRNVTILQPKNAEAFRALGQALVQTKQPEEAEKVYEEALKLEPENLEALNNISALTYRRGAYSETIKYSERALGLEKTEPEVVKRLAYAYLEVGPFSEAKRQFERALQITPSRQLRRDFAFALYNHEDYEAALSNLQRLAESEDASTSILHALGDTYLALGRPERAVGTYTRLHEKNPTDEDAIQGLLICYQKMGEGKKVEKYRKRLLKTESKNRR